MTIRLLCAYDKYPANAIVMLDAGTEAGLIAAKQATATLTGGNSFLTTVLPIQQAQPLVGGGRASIKAAEQVFVALPEGQALSIIGAASTSATAQQLNAAGAVVQSWSIGAGAAPQIGPFSGAQKILISCAAGSLDALVGDATVNSIQVMLDTLANPLYFAAPGGISLGMGGIQAALPSGDLAGVTDRTNLNAALAKAAAGFGRLFIRRAVDGSPYVIDQAVSLLSNVHIEFEPGARIKVRDKIVDVAAAYTSGVASISVTDLTGILVNMNVSDPAANLQNAGNAFGSIPYGAQVASVSGTSGPGTITLMDASGAAINPTGTGTGLVFHPKTNVMKGIGITNASLVCRGWAALDGNWAHAYPYNSLSDDSNRNGLRLSSCSDMVIDGISGENNFYHGCIAVGQMAGIRFERWRGLNNGYRSIHFHSEAITGNAQPENRDNYFGRLETVGGGHRAFYTRNNDENNSGFFLQFQNCLNTQVNSILAKDEYGYTFVAAGGASAWSPNFSKYLQIGSVTQENCGMGVNFSSNVSHAQVANFKAWGKELSIASCIFYNTAAVLRYCVDATGTVRNFKTRLIDIPNVAGVGAIAAYGLRPGYRVYASGGSTGMNTIIGNVIWECLVGTGAGGVDQIRVFRDDDGTQDPYTTAATTTLYVHGHKGDGITLYAASGETVSNIKFGNVNMNNVAFGIQTQAANGVYRYADIDFGSVTVKRGYRLGINLSSIRGLKFSKLHTEDCASGFPAGGGGSTYDNYLQNCTGKVDNFTTTVNTGYTSTSKALRLDTETRNVTVVAQSLQKSSSGQLVIESLVTSGAPANSAGVAGAVVLVNPTASDGTSLTTAAGNISRVDATSCIITRPVDAP